MYNNTGKALEFGHPRDAKMVSVTAAGRLRECKNTEFVWELRKTGFCGGVFKKSCLLTSMAIRRASTVLF